MAMKGSLTVVYGPMFASKTTELLTRLKRAKKNGEVAQAFRPMKDTRHEAFTLRSHNGEEFPAILAENGGAILKTIGTSTNLVVIDEVNLFPEGTDLAIASILERGIEVWVAGMDKDWRAKPFPPIPTLIKHADQTISLFADCEQCGKQATHSQRLGDHTELIVPGGGDLYEPRCGDCYLPPSTS